MDRNKSLGADFWESYQDRPRESTARRQRLESRLPLYNPDVEAEEVRRLRNRKRPLRALFRYATWIDYILMTVGVVAAFACAITFPLLIEKQGEILHYALEIQRCEKLTGHRNYSSTVKGYSESILGWFTSTMEFFGLYFFTFVLFVLCFAFAAENQISQLRITYFESLVRKDMSWLDNFVEREFGRHMTHDITQIRSAIGEKLCYLVYLIVVIVGLLIMAFIEQWKIAFIVLVLGPVLLCVAWISTAAENHEATYLETITTNSGVYAEETFANIKTVKVYEGEEKEFAKYASALNSVYGWRWILLAGSAGITNFIMYLSFAVVFYFGSSIVWLDLQDESECRDHLDLGWDGPEDLFVCFFCVLYASLHIYELPTIIHQLRNATDVASEVFFMIDWKPRIDNMSLSGDLPEGGIIGKIQFENVSFRYPRKPTRLALSRINMTISPGQVIAFVGPMACGKSTVLHLIQRLYDPTSGNVYIDGHNIENLNVQWLRMHTAKVSQEPVLFNKSVEENVRFAKWSASFAEVEQACKMAGIHDDIMQLKNGYQTVVGQHGSILNTSQKRQLSFARAYLQAPKILILDDPIAGCVPDFEALVLRVISELRDRTTIVLASTVINSLVQHADRIYCMDKGSIVEQGNHDDLMSLKGVYVDLKNSVNSGTEQNKFISQLTSYRFAQSLRRMHLRKARASHHSRRKSHGIGVNPSSASYMEATHHALTHDSRVKTTQAIVLRVAGGLQRCNYTRTQANSMGHIRRNLSKAVKKVKHEIGLKQEVFGTDQSIAALFANKMRFQRESFSMQCDEMARKPRTTSGGSFHSDISAMQSEEDSKSIVSTVPSMASEDSLIFWADYEDMLDNLEEVHSVTSWTDLFKLGLLEWYFVLACMISSFAVGCCTPFYYLIFDDIFDAFTMLDHEKSDAKAFRDCEYLVILGVVSGIFGFLQELVCSYGGFRLIKNMRKRLFSHILKQDQEWFDKPENDVSFLCARLSTDTTLVENVLILSLGSITQSLTSLFLAIYLAFTLEGVQLVSSYVLGMGLVLLVVIYMDGVFQKEYEWITDIKALDEATEIEIDVITNIRTVITLGLEAHFLNDFKKEIKKSKRKLVGINILRSLLFGLASALPFGMFSFAVHLFYLENKFEPRFAEILAISGLLIFGIIPIGTALALVPNTSLSLAAAYRVNKIFSTKPKANRSSKSEEPKTVMTFENGPKIEFRNVEFSFNSNIQYSMLHGVNIVAGPEDKIAVVGPEGCGKSSVIQLLLGLYHPKTGTILVDDTEFKKIDIKSIRRMTGYVEQNPTIFDCTIGENIAYGDNSRKVPQTEIIQAAKAAYAHVEITRLPEGYNSQISSLDSFQEHSFGLRQRIVFARAILRDPKLLLIDESTASVDPQSDLLLLRTLDDCCIGRTTIMSSQRIEPIRNADMIFVVKNGQIVEKGTDHELIESRGDYFHMYMTQREAEGFSTDPDDLEYGEAIENYYRHVSMGDGGLGASDSNEILLGDTRRKSSMQYINYLKNRLHQSQLHRDSSANTIAGYLERFGSSNSIPSEMMNEYSEFIQTVDQITVDAMKKDLQQTKRPSQGQRFLKSLKVLNLSDSDSVASDSTETPEDSFHINLDSKGSKQDVKK